MQALEKDVAIHPLRYALASWFVLLFGFWLLVVWPGMRAEHALDAATQAHHEQYTRLDHITNRLSLHGKWYQSGLIEPIQDHVRQAERAFSVADAKLLGAKQTSDRDDQYRLAKAATDSLNSCAQQLEAAGRLFGQLQEERAQTRAHLAASAESLASAKTSLAALRISYDNVHGSYLSKYRHVIAGDLQQADTTYTEAERTITGAALLLPEEGDTAQKGNPAEGRVLLDQVDAVLERGMASQQAAQQAIELQRTASTEARPAISTAQARATASLTHLQTVAVENHFTADKALRAAYAQREEGLHELDVAKQAIATKVEGDKYDYVLAYTAAQRAIAHFSDVVTSADTQAKLKQEVLQSITLVQRGISEAVASLNDAERSRETLERYHADSAWSDVRDNVQTGRVTISRVRASLQQAAEYAGEEQQRFEQAKEALSSSNALLAQVRPLSNAVSEREQTLERARSAWPSTQQRTATSIAAGARDVASYGEYEPSTRSQLGDATRRFEEAKSRARSFDYTKAIRLAEEAATMATSAGNAAESAYDDYQEEQRRAARAAEAAAEAAAAVLQQDTYSSGSVYGGGSSYGGGGSSYGGGGDGAGYSSPSRASDGYGW